jgi:hypothetical protein
MQVDRTEKLTGALRAKVSELKVDDETLKMMNLCRDLLHSILPFVLTKIDRVSYGLLSLEQIERERAGTHFTCFTSTKVRILTRLRQPST